MSTEYDCKVVDADGQPKIYKMRKCSWLEDSALTARLVDTLGQPVFREIWIQRLARDVVGVTDADLRKMDRQTFSTLIQWWTVYNESNPQSFLPDEPKIPTDSTSSSSIS